MRERPGGGGREDLRLNKGDKGLTCLISLYYSISALFTGSKCNRISLLFNDCFFFGFFINVHVTSISVNQKYITLV